MTSRATSPRTIVTGVVGVVFSRNRERTRASSSSNVKGFAT